MLNPVFYPRSVERRLVEALENSPVVLIHGPPSVRHDYTRSDHLRAELPEVG